AFAMRRSRVRSPSSPPRPLQPAVQAGFDPGWCRRLGPVYPNGVPKATTMGYKLQAYLHKNRHGTFAFRWRPPRDVAIQFSQASIVYSLGTKERSIARGRALYACIRAN